VARLVINAYEYGFRVPLLVVSPLRGGGPPGNQIFRLQETELTADLVDARFDLALALGVHHFPFPFYSFRGWISVMSAALGWNGGKMTLRGKNDKGCGIGYVLAASSCEGASSVGARTVAALDVIAAFAAFDL
jgi:hypothetical protein